MSNKALTIYADALRREEQEHNTTQAPARTSAQPRDNPRAESRGDARAPAREVSRGLPRGLPTRDEIQTFSFQLRDELKVKVQAEVPHHWQTALEDLARELDVKKLELYRFIIGEFLGKVQRGQPAPPEE